MKSLLALLTLLLFLKTAFAENTPIPETEIILPASPPQKVFSRYQTDFGFHHDRGFYFSAALAPQWNHSLANPPSKALRFGGKINAGGFVSEGIPIFGSVWGNFLEAASLIAIGPGVAFLFDSTNLSVDISLGIGRVFNALSQPNMKDFSETALASNVSIGKYWWISNKSSLGISILTGVHGFSPTQAQLSSIGWNAGLGIAFLFG